MGLLRDLFSRSSTSPASSEPDDGGTLIYRNEDLFNTQIADFWASLATGAGASNPTLLERVWVANRCQHMNANAVSAMPLNFTGKRLEPAWVAAPDPNWYPNGIGDAVYCIVWSMYGWGDAFLYITNRYADGYPSNWTVLDPAQVTVESVRGQRTYRVGTRPLDENDIVQISRDPRGGLRGTSAISSYSPYTNGLLAAADLGRVMMGSGGTPNAVLKSSRKISPEQATALQSDWMTRTALRRGAPAVLPPEIDFEQLSFSPKDLLLLDVQKFDAQVIASAYGVPATFLNMSIEGGLNYTTPVLGIEQWWRTELRPTAKRISDALTQQMLARGSYVEFNATDFLAPSFPQLVESWVKLFKEGAVSREELRVAVLGLPADATEEEALAELSEPSGASTTPTQEPGAVVSLRPTQVVT